MQNTHIQYTPFPPREDKDYVQEKEKQVHDQLNLQYKYDINIPKRPVGQ